jgi:Domain of unknown function (DUF1707)
VRVEPGREGVRASDTERELVVERLGRAMAQGRLTVAEFDERAAAAHAARTREELAELTRDLPGRLW